MRDLRTTQRPESLRRQSTECTYFFNDLECMKTNGDTYVKLMKNAANTGIESYCHGLGDIDNSSTLGVLYLEAGDMVSIRLSNSDSKIFGYKTIFSGFLI